MEFDDTRPIHRQVADYAYNHILEGLWTPEMGLPSVRELAAELGVNTRTVLKAMEQLQESGIITPRRGMGYLLAPDAAAKARDLLKTDFFEKTIPALAADMIRLGIKPEELMPALETLITYKKKD